MLSEQSTGTPPTLTMELVEDRIRRSDDTLLPGWALFPTVGKRPALKWTQAATADPESRARLANRPHDGWAVACGPSGLLVVDLDRHDEDGVDEWVTWLAHSGVPEGSGNPRVIGSTPSDGRHLYYAGTGAGNRTAIRGGIDIRGVGGYVVFAGPSRALKVLDWAFPPAPGPLLDALTNRPGRPRLPPPQRDRRDVSKGLAGACERLAREPEGNRNGLLYWAARTPGVEAILAGVPVERVTSALLAASTTAGLPTREAARTIHSALHGAGI